MNPFKKAVIVCWALPLTAAIYTNAASVAQVVSEDPDGAIYRRGGSHNVTLGMDLMEGDVLESGNATLILSLCQGSLLTIYPKTVLNLESLVNGAVSLKLVRGEVLGDATAACTFSVQTKVGTASISNGVYGVVHNVMGDAWTLQVRNLDGTAKFIGDLNLDTSKVSVSLIEPGKVIEIPAGEEIVVRGIYNEASGVFTINPGGAALAQLNNQVVGNMKDAAAYMSSVFRQQQNKKPSQIIKQDETIIEIPYEDVETASGKG